MINLLPPKEQQELLFQKNRKLVILLGNAVLISLLSLALVLFSVKFYILGELTYQKATVSSMGKQYETPDFLFFKGLIESYNASLVRMHNFYKEELPVGDVIKTILEVKKPTGLYLTSIAIEKNGPKNKVKVSLYGTSDNRDSLLLFKNGVENNAKIKNVYFPPNNWIKPSDLQFYITLNYEMPN